MWPRSSTNKLIGRAIALVLAASIIDALDGGWLVGWTALVPARIWQGEIWRLVTWPLIAGGPVSLIFTCAAIYKFGGELAPRWGERRLRRFVIEILGSTAVATALLALISAEVWHRRYFGGWAACDVLTIAWARQYPDSELVLYGLVRLNGRNLIAVVIAITCAYAIFAGPLAMAPELLACAAAYGYPGTWLARRP